MNNSTYVYDVTEDTFPAIVLEGSREVPVLVDFWAPWCAPCKILMPLLAKLADEYHGKFLLAKVNTDEQQQLAQEQGIRSLPTVRMYKDGKVVDECLGAQPESAIRVLIDRHIERESDRIHAAAIAAYRKGDVEHALALFDRAREMAPQDYRISLDLAELLLEQGDDMRVEQILNELPLEAQGEAKVDALRARLEFTQVARGAPDVATLEQTIAADPADSEARYQLAALRVLSGDYKGALEQLLEILRHDRGFRDDAGRKGLVAVFNLLGNEGELVQRYRTLMARALH